MYKNLFYLLIFFLFLHPTQSFCEYDSNLKYRKFEIIKKITTEKSEIIEVLNFSNKLLVESLQVSGSKDFIYSIKKYCSVNNTENLEKLIEAQKGALKHDLGIKLKAGIRSSTGDLNLYNDSAFVGFSWDIVKGGLLENRLKAKELSIEQAINSKNLSLQKRRLLSLCRQNFISYYFARLKIPVLKERLKILEKLLKVKKEGYFYGIELADSLAKIKRDIEKTKAKLRQFKQLVYTYCTIERVSFCKYQVDSVPPVLSVEFSRVAKELNRNEATKEEEGLSETERLLSFRRNWKHNVKLQAYLYYNTKGDNSFFVKQGFVAGINLSIPLGKKYDEVDRLTLLKKQNSLERQGSYLENYANLLFREEEEKVSDAVSMWYGMDISLERIRRASFRLGDELKKGVPFYGDYVALLESLKDYLDSEFEFISSEELLYRRVVNLLTITGVDWRDKIKNVELVPLGNRFRIGERFVLIKKEMIKLFPTDFIARFLYTKGIKGAIVDRQLLRTGRGYKLIKVLKDFGIKCYILNGKTAKFPSCLVVKKINNSIKNESCIILNETIEREELRKLLGKTELLFVLKRDMFFPSEKIGVFVNLKHVTSELELERKLEVLFKSGIKKFLFNFDSLINICNKGGVN